jgi:spectinomycin phosphotransferase
MLENPGLPDQEIVACLQDEYGLQVSQVSFLPLGADVNTAVYRVTAADGAAYFLKLRSGSFAEITVSVPQFLKAQGNPAILAPLETNTGQCWTRLDAYMLILYPYIEGQNGYEAALSNRQWVKFGAALRSIHTVRVPSALAGLVPREGFAPDWRELVKTFQVQVERTVYAEPVAAQLAGLMRAKRDVIGYLVSRAEKLAVALQARSLDLVLCHSDIHAGNLLLGADEALYIVDWDNPIFAPKERDLILVGGSAVWNSACAEELFYQGYGKVEIDPFALAYYRYERIIQDIAEFCQQLLWTSDGGQDRAQSLEYFTSNFLPGHEIDIALRTDDVLVRTIV